MGKQLNGLTQAILNQAQVGLQFYPNSNYAFSSYMSLTLCQRICSTGSFQYMGIVNGVLCGCGNSLRNPSLTADQAWCDNSCGTCTGVCAADVRPSATDKCCGYGSYEAVYKIQYTSKLIIQLFSHN